MATLVDLTQLPPPRAVEEFEFEQILARHRAELLQRMPAAAEALELESEPLTKLLQAFSYGELLFRQRVNEAVRSNLLAFAVGGDLDHKGAFYNVERMPGEADERLRRRIQLRIASLAGNGTAEQYKLLAMSASANVRDAAVSQPRPGAVELVLWLVAPDEAPTTLPLVHAALNAEGARPLGVPVSVSLATPKPVAIAANLWREASAPVDLVARLAAALPGAIEGYAQLGRAVPRSWITARLHVAGIARVRYEADDQPPEHIALASHEYPVIGSIALTDQGIA